MNPSINALKASDGSGNASVATVSNSRAPLATTIQVDTVQGINDDFFGTMGTPHTFTDPITGETITVISEATAVDFRGHVDGSNLEIDEIAPGYTDAGSSVGDIVIIRPTTQWGDQVAEVLGVSHNDNGTIKNDAITTKDQFVDALDPVLRDSERVSNFIASGGAVAQSAGLVGTFSNIIYYIAGARYTVSSVANKTYLASKDTYVDIGIDGVVDYNDVANGAAAPALASDHIRVAKVVTNGSAITSVLQAFKDSLGNFIYPRKNGAKVTDANGWTAYYRGDSIEYRKRLTFSQTIAGLAILGVSSTNLPVGMATLAQAYMGYSFQAQSNAGVLQIVWEGSTGSTALQFTTATTDTVSRAYNGIIDMVLVTT